MLISIWGRDGSGKSTLADALGVILSKEGLVVVIDTDLTQPTLPARLPGTRFDSDTSLGKAIAGTGMLEARPYLHQHQKHTGLFYAGLTLGDEYITYEVGLEANDTARKFIENCLQTVDHVILDCSGQRDDPFVPEALIKSNRIILLNTPDLQGICWLQAVKPMLERVKASERLVHVVSEVRRHHSASWIEKAAGVRFTASLPYVRELNEIRSMGKLPDTASTPAAFNWNRQVKRLFDTIETTQEEAS